MKWGFAESVFSRLVGPASAGCRGDVPGGGRAPRCIHLLAGSRQGREWRVPKRSPQSDVRVPASGRCRALPGSRRARGAGHRHPRARPVRPARLPHRALYPPRSTERDRGEGGTGGRALSPRTRNPRAVGDQLRGARGGPRPGDRAGHRSARPAPGATPGGGGEWATYGRRLCRCVLERGGGRLGRAPDRPRAGRRVDARCRAPAVPRAPPGRARPRAGRRRRAAFGGRGSTPTARRCRERSGGPRCGNEARLAGRGRALARCRRALGPRGRRRRPGIRRGSAPGPGRAFGGRRRDSTGPDSHRLATRRGRGGGRRGGRPAWHRRGRPVSWRRRLEHRLGGARGPLATGDEPQLRRGLHLHIPGDRGARRLRALRALGLLAGSPKPVLSMPRGRATANPRVRAPGCSPLAPGDNGSGSSPAPSVSGCTSTPC